MPELCVLHAHCAALWIQDPIVLVPSRHQRSLTDTDAACRRLKLVKQPRLTCLSGKDREREREQEKDQSIRHIWRGLQHAVCVGDHQRGDINQSRDGAKRQSKLCQTVCKQFSNSSTYRDKDAAPQLNPTPTSPIPSSSSSCLALSCSCGLKPKTRVDIDSKISGRSVQSELRVWSCCLEAPLKKKKNQEGKLCVYDICAIITLSLSDRLLFEHITRGKEKEEGRGTEMQLPCTGKQRAVSDVPAAAAQRWSWSLRA